VWLDWFELPPMPHKGRISSLHSDNGGAQSRICRIAPSKQRKQRLETRRERSCRGDRSAVARRRGQREERQKLAADTVGHSEMNGIGVQRVTPRASPPPSNVEESAMERGVLSCLPGRARERCDVRTSRSRDSGRPVKRYQTGSDGTWKEGIARGDGEGHEGTRDEAEAEGGGGERERRRRESGEAWPCESEESLDDLTGEDGEEQGLRVRNGLARGMLGCWDEKRSPSNKGPNQDSATAGPGPGQQHRQPKGEESARHDKLAAADPRRAGATMGPAPDANVRVRAPWRSGRGRGRTLVGAAGGGRAAAVAGR